MLIAGIDPGLFITGYGIIGKDERNLTLIDAGVVQNNRRSPLEQRLKKLFNGVNELLKSEKPAVVVVEELYLHYKHPHTAVLMGHARGIIYLVSAMNNMPVFSFKPTHIKKAVTGNGHASKEQICSSICSMFGLKKFKGLMDVTDALAVAVAYAHTILSTK
jgi:crossover junction endodeoxyribonuclease RuvC